MRTPSSSLNKAFRVMALVSTVVLASCGGGGAADGGSGTMHFALTDAPACGYDHVYVTMTKLRVHQSATASATDAGWTDLVISPARRIDLLDLTNGALADLGQTPLPAGRYTQMRVLLAANPSSGTLANAVVRSGTTTEVPLTTPSALQSGLKMNVDLTIAANQMADFVLDFNACKSVVTAGASGNVLLKPVLTVTPLLISGVAGYLNNSFTPATTNVSLQDSTGVVVKATVPDSTGRFLLQPVVPGTYNLVITAPGAATEVIRNVVVGANTITTLNTSTSAFGASTSAVATVQGSVTSASDATLSAQQSLTAGGTVEVASTVVAAPGASYSFGLPLAAPMVADYAPSATSYTLAADTAAAANYTLNARNAIGTWTSNLFALLPAGVTFDINF